MHMKNLAATRPFESIVVVGCGSIGLPLATAFALQGFSVLGHDLDRRLMARLAADDEAVTEPTLAAAITQALAQGMLHFSAALQAGAAPRAYIIAVPTPWHPRDGFDDTALNAALDAVFAVARPGDAICIRSTVPVGTNAAIAARAKAENRRVDIAATPDRSIEGRGFREQSEVPHLVGAQDAATTARVAALFGHLGPVVRCTSASEAEAAKLLCNVTRDVAFALANEVAHICDDLGLDSYAVRTAAGTLYPRFQLPRPGPVGGPCLRKDSHLLLASIGAPRSAIIAAAMDVNDQLPGRVAQAVLRHVTNRTAPRVALLGLAFKGRPAVADLRGSAALQIAVHLQSHGNIAIQAWDPVMAADQIISAAWRAAPTPLDAVKGADVIILANDHPELGTLDFDGLMAAAHPDAWLFDLCGETNGRGIILQPGQTLKILGGGARYAPAMAMP